jgi:hypothetical protein
MKKLKILLTMSMTFMLLSGIKAANRTELRSPATLVSPSPAAGGFEKYLEKYWGFSNQAFHTRFTERMRLVNWGEDVSLADDFFVFDTDTVPNTMSIIVTSSYTYSIRVEAIFSYEYCGRSNPPNTDSQVYAYIQSTGSTPYYYKNVVSTPDGCEAPPALRTLTGTIPAGTYQITVLAGDYAIGTAWW